MTILKIIGLILGTIGILLFLVFLWYIFSFIQMKAWIDSFNNTINELITKQKIKDYEQAQKN